MSVDLEYIDRRRPELLKCGFVAAEPAPKDRICGDQMQRVTPDVEAVFAGNVGKTQDHSGRRQNQHPQDDNKT